MCKNGNAIAVLGGNESRDELNALAEDIFAYFGLGCRNVSRLFVPKDYDFAAFYEGIEDFSGIGDHHKYRNNYDYNKTVYLMSQISLLENGFLVLKEDPNYASPIATLFYEYYESIPSLEKRLTSDKEQIQCVVTNDVIANSVPFGKTQQPQLWDYADGVDTMKFLLQL